MSSRVRPMPVARLLLSACLLLTGATAAPQATPTAAPESDGPSAAAVQVRLRKLHLVRPDLIPYPIAYEVCC